MDVVLECPILGLTWAFLHKSPQIKKKKVYSPLYPLICHTKQTNGNTHTLLWLREAWRRDEGGTGVSTTGNRENKLTLNTSTFVIYKYVQNFRRTGKTNTENDEQRTEPLKEC